MSGSPFWKSQSARIPVASLLGCGFLGRISDVGAFFFNTNDITSKYFLKFYPLFVSRRYQVTGFWPWDYDTDAHKQLIFDKLKQSPFMTKTGASTKFMRFPTPPFEEMCGGVSREAK